MNTDRTFCAFLFCPVYGCDRHAAHAKGETVSLADFPECEHFNAEDGEVVLNMADAMARAREEDENETD